MSILEGKIRRIGDDVVAFMCPGCKSLHLINTDASDRPAWSYNGNPNAPTFAPSVLLRTGHYMNGHSGDCWCDYNKARPDEEPDFECVRCHSFVRDGRIQFLNDSTHYLAGQTVDLPDIVAP